MSAPLRLSRPTQAGTRKLAIRATRRARSESRVPSPESRLSAIHRQPAALRGYHLAYPRDHGVVIRRVEHVGDGIGQLDTISFRSEEHTSELQSLMRTSYAVFCLKKKK